MRPSLRRKSPPEGRWLSRMLYGAHLPEALMLVALVVFAVAGMSLWSQSYYGEPGVPALLQPVDVPIQTESAPPATPAPSPTTPLQPAVLPARPTPVPPTPTPRPLPAIRTAVPTVEPATSPPTRLIIPSIGLDTKVVETGWQMVNRDGQEVAEWIVADYAAGFHKSSAYPGTVGNTVISGHHNVRGKVFRYLVNVKPGDIVVLYADNRAYTYRVETVQILPEKYASAVQRLKNAEMIGYFPDERLTMVTCWPLTSNTHRVVVVAKPVHAPG